MSSKASRKQPLSADEALARAGDVEAASAKRAKAKRKASPAKAAAASSAASSSAASSSRAADPESDDEVEFLEETKPAAQIHARYDCHLKPMRPGFEREHCERCWCGVCEMPVSQCGSWPAHCTLTAAKAKADKKAKRAADVEARLATIPMPARLVPGAPGPGRIMADPLWKPMRYTLLNYVANCSKDEDSVLQSVCSVHDQPHDVAAQVLETLCADGEVIKLDGELHVRPGTDLSLPAHVPPPQPMPHASMQAALQAALQAQAAQRQRQLAAMAVAGRAPAGRGGGARPPQPCYYTGPQPPPRR